MSAIAVDTSPIEFGTSAMTDLKSCFSPSRAAPDAPVPTMIVSYALSKSVPILNNAAAAIAPAATVAVPRADSPPIFAEKSVTAPCDAFICPMNFVVSARNLATTSNDAAIECHLLVRRCAASCSSARSCHRAAHSVSSADEIGRCPGPPSRSSETVRPSRSASSKTNLRSPSRASLFPLPRQRYLSFLRRASLPSRRVREGRPLSRVERRRHPH